MQNEKSLDFEKASEQLECKGKGSCMDEELVRRHPDFGRDS